MTSNPPPPAGGSPTTTARVRNGGSSLPPVVTTLERIDVEALQASFEQDYEADRQELNRAMDQAAAAVEAMRTALLTEYEAAVAHAMRYLQEKVTECQNTEDQVVMIQSAIAHFQDSMAVAYQNLDQSLKLGHASHPEQ